MIYVFSQDYPSKSKQYAMTYVHSRNLIYKESGLSLKVVSMSAKNNYLYEGIEVITKTSFEKLVYKESLSSEDIVISHAPNLKNHLKLIWKIDKIVKKIIFVFHGHEVLETSKYYPTEYPFKKKSNRYIYTHKIYDKLKLYLLRYTLKKLKSNGKVSIFCVSQWMKENAETCLKMKLDDFDVSIINNNASNYFINNSYKPNEKKKADFITVRPLDNSKYAIDQVVNLARKNPNYTFHIFGRGEFFKYYERPSNVEVLNTFIHPSEFPKVLNDYNYALMPTKLDAQGVMMCEMATYGIPTITSNLDVCKEMLIDFENVYLASNEFFDEEIDEEILKEISIGAINKTKFNINNTVNKEVEYLKAHL